MFGFVVALFKEAEYFIEKLNNVKKIIIAEKTVYLGDYSSNKCAVIISGVGKVNASISTQILIDKFNVELIINFGSAGGIIDKVKTLNYYLIDKAVQYDFDSSALPNLKKGQIPSFDNVFFTCQTPNLNLETKTLATADRFTHLKKDYSLVEYFKASIYDMEGAAVCQTAKLNGVKAILIKGITDVSNSNNFNDFENNLEKLSIGFPKIIENLLNNIN